DGHLAVLYAAVAQHGGRSHLVRDSLPAVHADRIADPAVRVALVCVEGRSAAQCNDRYDLSRSDSLRLAHDGYDGADLYHPGHRHRVCVRLNLRKHEVVAVKARTRLS